MCIIGASQSEPHISKLSFAPIFVPMIDALTDLVWCIDFYMHVMYVNFFYLEHCNHVHVTCAVGYTCRIRLGCRHLDRVSYSAVCSRDGSAEINLKQR